MAFTFTVSNRYLTQSLDLTATPQAVFTNSSTYTRASLVAAVAAEEVSGGGYVRPTLTVTSNAINADGFGELTFAQFSLTATGAAITYDRVALFADGDWVGWYDTGSTTIADGSSKTYALTFVKGESGVSLTGADGESAYTITTANFTQPAISGTVAVSVEATGWLAVGAYCFFTDDTNIGFYKVSAIGGATSVTLENLGYDSSAAPATTMLSGGKLVPSGVKGSDGAQFETFTGAPASFTPSQADFIAIKTDATPNLFYRTTGTTPGALSPWGNYQTFTGDPGAYTPTTANILHIRTDATPNLLYRSTGLTLGALQEVGGGSGGGSMEGTLVLNRGTGDLLVDEIGIDGATFTLSSSLVFADAGGSDGMDWSLLLYWFRPMALLRIVGQESGAVAWFPLLSASYDGGANPPGIYLEIDTSNIYEDGTFLDGERISVAIGGGSPVFNLETKTSNFSTWYYPARYLVDVSGGSVTATVGLAANGKNEFLFKVLPGTSGNVLTVNRSGSDLLEGSTSLTLSEGEAITLHSDGSSNWWIS